MSGIESQLRAELATALHRLEDALGVLDARLAAETGFPLWVWQQADPREARDHARAVVRAIDYVGEQAPSATRICPALMGASPGTLAAARAVNRAKAELKAALAPMDGRTITLGEDPETGEPIEKPLLKVALRALKHPRFHRRQALRNIVVLDEAPTYAAFTWARLRKIQTTTVASVRADLLDRIDVEPSAALLAQLERLDSLPPDEPLAIVKPPHVHPRVNLLLPDASKGEGATRPAQRRATLPVLYPAERGEASPRLRPLAEEPPPGPTRRTRRDQRVDPEAFLPSLHIHRYLSPRKEAG
jgi:hypothetical protein